MINKTAGAVNERFDFPQQPLAEMAELARILGHHHRLILLEHIARDEQPVERLVEASGSRWLTLRNTCSS